jgi:hypothetical protein
MATKKIWMYRPPRRPKQKLPERMKGHIQEKANGLIESELKPKHITQPAEDQHLNYIVDIYAKWYQNYLHFCAKYRCPAPGCIEEFFEIRFARMEYVGFDRFNLSYMRHTGQWWELYAGLSLDECLEAIRSEPHFRP